jgi:hypothetical protein
MLGDATGQHRYEVGADPEGIVTGDFTGDDQTDIAVTLKGSDAVAMLPGNGDGTLGSPVVSPAWGRPTSLVAVDLDGDGVLDLAGPGSPELGDGRIWTLHGTGDGTFADPTGTEVSDVVWGIATADFDDDGVPDLAATDGSTPGDAIVLLGRGDGTFRTPKLFSVPLGPLAIVTGDFDGDGRVDLATVDPDDVHAGHVSFLFGRGGGRFTPAVDEEAVLAPVTAAVADFDGDGRDDLAVSQQGSYGLPSDVSVYLGRGSRHPLRGTRFMAGFGGGGLATGDLNGDGDVDLVCAFDGGNRGSIAFAFGRGDGTFVAAPTVAVGQDNPHGVAVTDLNGDDRGDVVTSGMDGISVLLGKAKGGFEQPILYRAYESCCSMALSDLDANGTIDLVVPGDEAAQVFLGRGDGTFGDPTSFSTRGRSGDVAVGDVTGDGRPDLVVASDYNAHLAVLHGRGDGTFGRPHLFDTDPLPFTPVIADLDRDGHPDIAVASQEAGAVSILFGDGSGNFGPPVSIEAGSQATAVTAADLDADGRPDLVVTDQIGVTVLMARTGGGFAPPETYAGAGIFYGLVVIDVNGDGHLDIAEAHGGGATLLVFLGRGDGTFDDARAFLGVGYSAVALATADLDHDGRYDFVATETTYVGAIVLVMQVP